MSPMSQLQGPSMMKGDFKNRSEDASHEAIKYQSANGSTDQDKAKIAARLTSAAIFAKPFKYHSSDLVPLKHAYDSLRKELSALIYCAKKYRDEIIQLDKARLDVVLKFGVLATNSLIFGPIGNSLGGDSMVAVTQAASEQAHDFATAYQDKVVDYCVEWERTVTAHVDTELAVTNTSQERLNHYQSKIVELNKKMENYNKKSAKVPKKFSEKLARNEIKLNKAHEEYERSASVLCNLIEEVTLRGWKDLYPLVKENIKLEVARAVGENAVFNKLSEVVEELNEAFNNIQSSEQYVSQDSTASATGESNSRITGPFYLVGDASAQSAISEFNRGEARAFPDRNDRPKDDLMRKSENNVPVEQVTTQLPSTLENSESEVETTGPFHAMYDAPREEREDSISATTSLFSEAPASPNRNHAQEDGPVVALEINLTPLVETPRQENRGRESGIMQSFNSVGAVAGKNI